MPMRVGAKNLHYALLAQDTDAGVVYGTPKKIAGLNELGINIETSTAEFYADDGLAETDTAFSKATVDLTLKDIPQEDQAILLGQTVTGGVMIGRSSDKAPYVALGWESELSDGNKEFVWLTKGKFQIPNDTYKTKGENLELQPAAISGTFQRRDYDNHWRYKTRTDAADYVSNTGDDWFDNVGGVLADITVPTVTCNITDGATSVAVDTNIVFTFSETVAASTITTGNIILMTTAGVAVSGALSLDADRKVATFNPVSNLSAATDYMAIVTTNVKDLAGNKLAAPMIINFTTA